MYGEYSLSIETQRARAQSFIDTYVAVHHPDHKFNKETGCYIDDGVPGDKPMAQRPGGGRLLLAAKPGDVIVMVAWDRGFRSLIDFLNTVDEWRRKGIFAIAANLPLDLNNEIQYLMVKMMALIAESEGQSAKRRRQESVVRQIREGVAMSGRTAPIGFKSIKGKNGVTLCVPNEEERKLARYFLEVRERENLTYERMYWYFRDMYRKDPKGNSHLLWRRTGDVATPSMFHLIITRLREGFPYYKGLCYEEVVAKQAALQAPLYTEDGLAEVKKQHVHRTSRREDRRTSEILAAVAQALDAKPAAVVRRSDPEPTQPDGDRSGCGPGVRDESGKNGKPGVADGPAGTPGASDCPSGEDD